MEEPKFIDVVGELVSTRGLQVKDGPLIGLRYENFPNIVVGMKGIWKIQLRTHDCAQLIQFIPESYFIYNGNL